MLAIAIKTRVERFFPAICFALAGVALTLIAAFLNAHGIEIQKTVSNGARFDGLMIDLLFLLATLTALGCFLAAISEAVRIKQM